MRKPCAAVSTPVVASDVPWVIMPNGCADPVPVVNATTSSRSFASAISAGTWVPRAVSCRTSKLPKIQTDSL